jgi:3-phenylpropionate/trans-cinnamate dioxygenase ferredoxin reductase subunit
VAQQDAQLTGPDLTQGIPSSDLGEKRPLLGHANGEPVVLARCDGRAFAVGAACTHYGAPLAEGTVVDGTIRCPWHHSAFSLETGAAVRPPALGDLPCWDLEERDGRVTVRGKRAGVADPGLGSLPPDAGAVPSRPATVAKSSDAPESVVIVGGGGAGLVAADTLRRSEYTGPITIISADRVAPVDRPNLSKDYLAGNAPEEWIPLRSDHWYSERSITLTLGRRVTSVDPTSRTVTFDDGATMLYGALLLATGAEPIRLSLGEGVPVHYLRTLDDSRAIIKAAESAKSVVVLGASFIGLEVAASLRARGLAVTVIAPESQPLERVLGASLGSHVRSLHESHGVVFRLGRMAKAATTDGVELDDGSVVTADLIVAGVGVRPSIALAEAAGLAIDRGVTVNEYLETSAPGVFAAGDIARWPDPRSGRKIRVEHWVVAQRQGQTAARNMLGANESFDAVPFFWSAHYDVTISYVGHAETPERIDVDGDPGRQDCTVRYYENGRVAAVATIGRDRASLSAEAEMERMG